MTVTEKRRKSIINVAYFAMIFVLAALAYKYAFGLFLPILIAFVTASLLQRPKNFIVKKTFLKKGVASTLCVFLALIIIFTLFAVIGVRVVGEIKDFIDYVVLQLQDLDSFVLTIENAVLSFVEKLPALVEEPLEKIIGDFFVSVREYIEAAGTEQAPELPEGLGALGDSFNLSWITKPLSGVVSTASKLPSVLIAIVITIVASCFMTADYDVLSGFIDAQLSEKRRIKYKRAKALLKSSLGKMGKAYLLIILITCTEMIIGLSVLKMLGIYNAGYIVIISLTIAIVDIIPVLGTGTVLLPWSVISLILGNYGMGIGLLVIYAVISVIRQIIEPKLVAGQLGLPPFVTISAMYLGLKTMGVLGVFIAPLLIIMIKLLNDEGIINLWKPYPLNKEEKRKNDEQEKTAETEIAEASGEGESI